MVTVILDDKSVVIFNEDFTTGNDYKTRIRALRMYLVLSGRYAEQGILSDKSCIIN